MSTLDVQAAEQKARQYLTAQLGPRAPKHLRLELELAESPLETEGPALIFSFELGEPGECAPASRRHYVCAGQTEPNYFPAYGLEPDDAYSVHVGTRFLLEMEVQKVEEGLEPPGARQRLDEFVANYARGAARTATSLAGLFRCGDEYFAVYRVGLNGADYYCMGADCPPGFYALVDHPPQAALRLHLGKLIRAEARRSDAPAEPA